MTGEKIDEIKKALQEIDIFNLISEGAPLDEYEFEIPELLEFISKANNENELYDRLYEFYSKYFIGHLIIKDKMKNLAVELIKIKNN
jgi:hypothetical protein